MYYFKLDGTIVEIHYDIASQVMDSLTDMWEEDETDFGELWAGVYDWEFGPDDGTHTVNIPKLNGGGEIPRNNTASRFFEQEIYGDAFLDANEHGVQKFNSLQN